ncbi:MAG TPA: hypothetical protein PLF85_02020 [Turneriella sp.]|nr:hypothetical protein [Turneriella sp.]
MTAEAALEFHSQTTRLPGEHFLIMSHQVIEAVVGVVKHSETRQAKY